MQRGTALHWLLAEPFGKASADQHVVIPHQLGSFEFMQDHLELLLNEG